MSSYLIALVQEVMEENANMETEAGVRLERRDFDLWPLVEALIQDLNPIAGTSSVKLVNQVSEDLSVFADASLIKRVFQNLIANAIHHAPAGEIVISARPVDGYVQCEVRDNGVGIGPEHLPHVFDKYETGNDSSSGFGLGLAICKTFVEAHGGTICVSSTGDRGTAFRFTLPKWESNQ